MRMALELSGRVKECLRNLILFDYLRFFVLEKLIYERKFFGHRHTLPAEVLRSPVDGGEMTGNLGYLTEEEECDLHGTVFMDVISVFGLGIVPNRLYELEFELELCGCRRTAKRSAFVRTIFPPSTNSSSAQIFATRQFMFNAFGQRGFVRRPRLIAVNLFHAEKIPIASEVQIAQIITTATSSKMRTILADNSNKRFVDNLLHEFFDQKRLLSKGDVFAVFDATSNTHFYFKVLSLSAENGDPALKDSSDVSSGIAEIRTAFASKKLTRCVECAPLRGGGHKFFGELVGAQFLSRAFCEGVERVGDFFARAFLGATQSSSPTMIGPTAENESLQSRPRPHEIAVCLASLATGGGPARLFVDHFADEMCVNVVEVNCEDLASFSQNTPPSSTVSPRNLLLEKVRLIGSTARMHAPCVIWLRNVASFSELPNGRIDFDTEFALMTVVDLLKNFFSPNETKSSPSKNGASPEEICVLMTCRAEELAGIHPRLANLVHEHVTVGDLTSADRRRFFESKIRGRLNWRGVSDEPQHWFLDSTKGYSLPELNQLISEADENAISRNFRSSFKTNNDPAIPLDVVEGKLKGALTRADLEAAMRRRQKALGDVAGVPRIPTVTWEDVGGLEEVKALIAESIFMSGFQPPAGDAGAGESTATNSWRRSGILLYGPPGCGKTLIAKAVANQFKMTFLSVKGPELLNQYVGQSEKNLRDVFAKARVAAPSILFFDELDSMASSRGSTGDSGGVMDRMVSQLLAEMDAIQYDTNNVVFVMAATNRPDLLDPCLTTPGRFDKSVMVGPARDVESKLRILRPVCKHLNFEASLTVEQIAEMCPETMSGAELHALMSNAAMHALKETILQLESPDDIPNTSSHSDKRTSVSNEKAVKNDEREEALIVIRKCHIESAIQCQ